MKRTTTVAVAWVLLVAGAAFAQPGALVGGAAKPEEAESATPAPTEEPEESALAVSEVIGRATKTDRELRELETAADPDGKILEIGEALPVNQVRLSELIEGAPQRIRSTSHIRGLRDLRAYWLNERKKLDLWNETLTKRVREFQEAIERLGEIEALWNKTRDEYLEKDGPEAVMSRIQETLLLLEAPRKLIVERRDAVLEIQAAVAADLDRIASILAIIADAESALRSGFLGADAPPIWEAIARGPQDSTVLAQERDALRLHHAALASFIRGNLDRVAIHLLVVLVAFLVLRTLNDLASRWPEDDAKIRASAKVLARPIAGALLVGHAFGNLLYPAAPSLFFSVLGLVGLVPLVRLLPPLLDRRDHPFVYSLLGIYVVDIVRELISPMVTLERLLFIGEMIAAAVAIHRALQVRPGDSEAAVDHECMRARPIVVLGARLAMVMCAAAAVANAFGTTAFSLALGEGVLFTLLLAVGLYALYRVFDGVVTVSLRSQVASRLNMVRDHRATITRRLLQVFRYSLIAIWFWIASDDFGFRDETISFVQGAMASEFAVGDLVFSPGGVIIFFLVFCVALLFSRLLRFTLDQDVLPRMDLPRGVPYAITAMLHYSILSVALFAALAAAGIDLSKFSLLVGALGVGVGFGLQNVVNNFVSGLILLFERPIQTHDVVEVGLLLGSVQRIGIRSSTLRTLDGAEVIVPNANLISDQVVNWTLSDRQRRVEINVGVKYGTDPERVLELLLRVANDDARILGHPKPDALFTEFGDSSLNFKLRAWTGSYHEWIQVRSDLNVAVNRALAEAGIEIPFPQRDLHLRTISDAAGAKLHSAGEADD